MKFKYIVTIFILAIIVSLISLIWIPISNSNLDLAIRKSIKRYNYLGYDTYSKLYIRSFINLDNNNYSYVSGNSKLKINRSVVILQLPYKNKQFNVELSYIPVSEIYELDGINYPRLSGLITYFDYYSTECAIDILPLTRNPDEKRYIFKISDKGLVDGVNHISGYYYIDLNLGNINVIQITTKVNPEYSTFSLSSDGNYLLLSDYYLTEIYEIDSKDLKNSFQKFENVFTLNNNLQIDRFVDVIYTWNSNSYCEMFFVSDTGIQERTLFVKDRLFSTDTKYDLLFVSEDRRGAIISENSSDLFSYISFDRLAVSKIDLKNFDLQSDQVKLFTSQNEQYLIIDNSFVSDPYIVVIELESGESICLSTDYNRTLYNRYKNVFVIGTSQDNKVIFESGFPDWSGPMFEVDIDYLINSANNQN